MCNGSTMMSICLGNSKFMETVKKRFRTSIGKVVSREEIPSLYEASWMREKDSRMFDLS